jgi:hypothetical protein
MTQAAYKAYKVFIPIKCIYNYSGTIASIYPDLTQILVGRNNFKPVLDSKGNISNLPFL